jgi:hypothetical protein
VRHARGQWPPGELKALVPASGASPKCIV